MESEKKYARSELPAKKAEVPALEVANEVIWVNPNFPNLPFDLKVKRPCKFGLFLTPSDIEKKWKHGLSDHILGISTARLIEEKLKTKKLEVRRGHYRSGIIGKVIFKDKDGNLYRDVDLKGIGLVAFRQDEHGIENPDEPIVSELKEGDFDLVGDHVLGFRNKKHAEHDAYVTEKMHQLGVRTHRVLALVVLEEIVILEEGNPRKISIDEAKKRRLIHRDMTPVVEVRAFGTKTRILEWGILRSNNPFRRKDILQEIEDARSLLIRELGKTEKEFDLVAYFNWLTETMGRNLGIMHKADWRHGYVHGLNMTLDGRLVDFDSAAKVYSCWQRSRQILGDEGALELKLFREKTFDNDTESAIFSLQKFFIELEAMKKNPNSLTLDNKMVNQIFWRGYNLARFGEESKEKISRFAD